VLSAKEVIMAEEKNLIISSDKSFADDVKEGVSIVDFWAPWCGPCQMFAPIFEKVAPKFEGKAKFVKLNVDENPITANQYGIMSIPTLAMFKDGEITERQSGFLDEEGLQRKVEEWIEKK